MSDFANILTDVKTGIEQLRTHMSEGNAGDLTGLTPKLQAMNEALAALPKEEGLKHEATLIEINTALDELTQDFMRQREAAKAGIEQLSTRLKASTAYAKSVAAGEKTDDSAE